MNHRKMMAGAITALTLLSASACRGSEDPDSDAETTDEAASSDDSLSTDAPDGEGTEAADEADSGSETSSAPDQGSGDRAVVSGSAECSADTPGIVDGTIKIGGTYPLSGPAAAYSSIPKGVDTWFQHLNDTDGGFVLSDGTVLKIEWTYLDDGYSPPKAVENAKQLVENDGVAVILNPLGTPNNSAIRDYMNSEQVPQLMVSSGASTWGEDIEEYPWTIGYQPDYESEGVAYAQYILQQNPDAKIGILYQNDDFGQDYLNGIYAGLGEENMDKIVAEVSYETTDSTVDNQVSQLKDKGADAYVIIATPQFAIQAIQRKAALGWEPDITIVSSVSSSVGAVMTPAGLENAEGLVTSAYIKDPTDPNLVDDPVIIEYRELLGQYYSDANVDDGFHLFGMSIAQTFEQLIEGIDGPICRESIMDGFKNFSWQSPPILLEGINIETGSGDAFPIQRIQMQQFSADEATWVSIGDVVDTASVGE